MIIYTTTTTTTSIPVATQSGELVHVATAKWGIGPYDANRGTQ